MATVNDIFVAWAVLLEACAPVFTQPSLALFQQLASAWLLCPGRHTVTAMIGVMHPPQRRPHDAYHRFLRAGSWSMAKLWRLLAQQLVRCLAPEGEIQLDCDDTLFHKSGRKVDGAGTFRDAVRSTASHVVYALGLNLVVVTLRVTAPWGGEPLGLPINLRLHRKGGPSLLQLATDMAEEVARWFPDRLLSLCADGAYASLAGRALTRTHITSRMRRDAALYEPPPPRRRRRRGRPRKKGRRLPNPEQLARRPTTPWTRATINIRGRETERLLWCRRVLWYKVCPDRMVLLVVVRDPKGNEPDDFFFTTNLANLDALPAQVASQYAGRWSIEDTFRNVKQYLGGEDPQCWKGQGPERAAALSLWLSAPVWLSYITTQGTKPSWPSLPWYPAKRTPSFIDALATLRRALWHRRIFPRSRAQSESRKIISLLVDVLARAA